MEDRITISVKGFGITHNAELQADSTAEEFIETCCKMAESLTYSPEQVRQALRLALDNRE
jgi:hypothetical protein